MSIESHGGIILTGENVRSRGNTCPSVTLYTTNLTLAAGREPGPPGENASYTKDCELLNYQLLVQTQSVITGTRQNQFVN
jgi:hypothetical protein